jgi:hypothetical protein
MRVCREDGARRRHDHWAISDDGTSHLICMYMRRL